MRDNQLTAFMDVFRRLLVIFPMRLNPSELDATMGSYFNLLRHHSLEAVTAGANAYMGTGKFFPKPAQWLEAIPRSGTSETVPEMSQSEAREYLRAAAKGWQDDPCGCPSCIEAGVTHRFLRHVPDEDRDGRDVRMSIGGRVVTQGHWAHGWELLRFYAAKEAFTTDYLKLIAAIKIMPRVTPKQIAAEGDDHTVEARLDRAMAGRESV